MNIIKILVEKGIAERLKETYDFAREHGLWNKKGEKALFCMLQVEAQKLGDKFENEYMEYIIANGYRSIFKSLGFEQPVEKQLSEKDLVKAQKELLIQILDELKALLK